MRIILLVLFVLLFSFSSCAQKKVAIDDILGDWAGESKCVGSNPSCHDEIVVYHLTRSKADSAKVHLSADKIVNGKPEFMGEFDFTFDPDKGTLTAEFKIPRTGGKGVWFLTVNRDDMEGTLTVYPENEIGRKIKVAAKKGDK